MSVYKRTWRSSDLSWAATTVIKPNKGRVLLGEGNRATGKQTTLLQAKDKTELREEHKPQLPQDILVPRDGGHAPHYLQPPPKAGLQLTAGRTQTSSWSSLTLAFSHPPPRTHGFYRPRLEGAALVRPCS